MEDIRFLKRIEGKLSFVDDEEQSDYACVPIKYFKEHYLTPKQMNGYEKAIEIIRERTIKELNITKTDKYGYGLVSAEYNQKDKVFGIEGMCCVTKSVPYAIKKDYAAVEEFILHDLKKYYGMLTFETVKELEYNFNAETLVGTYDTSEQIRVEELVRWRKHTREELEQELESWSEGKRKAYIDTLMNFYDKYGRKFILGLKGIRANYSMGNYQVSYYATDII